MLYSVRKNTKGHGNTYFAVGLFNAALTAFLTWRYSSDYLVIFCSSAALMLVIETLLAMSGLRKGTHHVFGRRLSRLEDLLLRAFVDGPTACVPAFFVADQFVGGNVWAGIGGAVLVVGMGSLFMGWRDRQDIRRLPAGEEPKKSVRAMTAPVLVMFLGFANTGCLAAIFFIPAPFSAHAFAYIIAYALLVILFFLINHAFGVRYFEVHDPATGTSKQPGPLFQIAALTYDSAFEMALLISPAYWGAHYLGLFEYLTL